VGVTSLSGFGQFVIPNFQAFPPTHCDFSTVVALQFHCALAYLLPGNITCHKLDSVQRDVSVVRYRHSETDWHQKFYHFLVEFDVSIERVYSDFAPSHVVGNGARIYQASAGIIFGHRCSARYICIRHETTAWPICPSSCRHSPKGALQLLDAHTSVLAFDSCPRLLWKLCLWAYAYDCVSCGLRYYRLTMNRSCS
jgi:hypothetical protein